MLKARWRVLSAFALLAAIACGDDTTEPAGSISVAASPTSLTVPQGGVGTVTVTLTRGGGFADAVTVAVEGLPVGVTASVSPSPLTGATTQATVTVTVANSVAPGTYTATIRASAPGVGSATTTYTLTVTAAATPNYSLTAAPVSVGQGASGTSTIGIQRTNFTGPVTLTLDAPPAGITGTFNPSPATGDQSTLTINVASTVAAGTHNLTVRGSAAGPGEKTATVALTVTAPSTFTLTAAPNAVTAAPGGSANSTITIARTNLTADVALSLVSPPTGITGTFTPATLTGSTLTSTLQINVASTVAPGTHTLTVQGVGGSVTRTATITLTVAAGSSVSFALQPTALTIQQGGSSQTTLNVTRNNFTTNITPAISGNPPGMTLTFNPNPITGNSANVTVNVGAAVPVGVHNVVITGGTGVPGNPTVTLPVTVTASTGGNNVTWDFCTAEGVPLRFWRLSGGTWAEVAPTVVGNITRFAFNIGSASGGVAFTMQTSALVARSAGPTKLARMVETAKQRRQQALRAMRLSNQALPQTSTFIDTFVLLGMASELAAYAEVCGAPSMPASKTFNVTGMGSSEAGQLGYGPGSASLSPSTPSYNVMVQPGSYDWAAVFGPQPMLPDFTSNWTAYRVGRNEAAPGSAVSINRTGAPSFVTAPFTVTGGAAGSLYLYSEFIEGARGSIVSFPIGSLLNNTSSGNMLFFQAADRLSTDLTAFTVSNVAQTSTVADLRFITRYFGAPPAGSTTFALPGAVPAFTVSQVGGLWSATGPIPAEYQTSVSPVTVSFEGNNGGSLLTIEATRQWLVANNMATTYTLTQPNLPNFQASWTPAAPLASTLVLMAAFDALAAPTAGTEFKFAGRIQMP